MTGSDATNTVQGAAQELQVPRRKAVTGSNTTNIVPGAAWELQVAVR